MDEIIVFHSLKLYYIYYIYKATILKTILFSYTKLSKISIHFILSWIRLFRTEDAQLRTTNHVDEGHGFTVLPLTRAGTPQIYGPEELNDEKEETQYHLHLFGYK